MLLPRIGVRKTTNGSQLQAVEPQFRNGTEHRVDDFGQLGFFGESGVETGGFKGCEWVQITGKPL